MVNPSTTTKLQTSVCFLFSRRFLGVVARDQVPATPSTPIPPPPTLQPLHSPKRWSAAQLLGLEPSSLHFFSPPPHHASLRHRQLGLPKLVALLFIPKLRAPIGPKIASDNAGRRGWSATQHGPCLLVEKRVELCSSTCDFAAGGVVDQTYLLPSTELKALSLP